jgi:hypothetical protein
MKGMKGIRALMSASLSSLHPCKYLFKKKRPSGDGLSSYPFIEVGAG